MGKSGFALLSGRFTTPSRMLIKLRFDKATWESFSFLYIGTGNKGISKGQIVADDGILWRVFGPIHLFPANIYLFKATIEALEKTYEICTKLAIKIPKWRQWRRSGIFIINFVHISLMFLLVTLNRKIICCVFHLIYYKSRHFSQKTSD